MPLLLLVVPDRPPWGLVAVALDQPGAVVVLDEAGHGLAELVDGVVQLGPQALLVEGADHRSAQPLVSGSPRKAASSAMPSQAIEPGSARSDTAVPGQAATTATSHIGVQPTQRSMTAS